MELAAAAVVGSNCSRQRTVAAAVKANYLDRFAEDSED